jgi:hypothetical protein
VYVSYDKGESVTKRKEKEMRIFGREKTTKTPYP